MFTRRMNQAFSSLTKRHRKQGHPVPFTELEFAEKITTAVLDGGCPYCFGALTWDNFSPDHVIPLSQGGSPHLSNIEIVCAPCNLRKGPSKSLPPLDPSYWYYRKYKSTGAGRL